MNRTANFILAVFVLSLTICPFSIADDNSFKPIFDGKSLKGWEGKDFWSVEDGAITGQTTKEKPTKGNTFIVWNGKLEDFELKLKFRIVGGNSGIQFRSENLDDFVVKGYQADFDSAGNWTGTLYDEKGRGVLAKRGSKVVVDENGKKEVVGKTAPEKEILESIKKEDWNDYHITAKGNHIVQKVNGLVTVDVTDNQVSDAETSGILALQLHAGPPMLVQFKDIQLKVIE